MKTHCFKNHKICAKRYTPNKKNNPPHTTKRVEKKENNSYKPIMRNPLSRGGGIRKNITMRN
jgi:hypothetical protein